MSKEFNNVVVLLGGRSSEREISLMTGNAVANALQRKNYHVDVIDWQGRESIAQILSKNYDCAFIALHGIDGEDGCVQSVLEILGIPYTGSGVLASALCMDKVKTKEVLKANSLPVLEHIYITKKNVDSLNYEEIINQVGLPLCVKPVRQGSSLGIYRVDKKTELENAIAKAITFGNEIMIEPWLAAGEYTVGILNGEPLPSIKIEAKKQFYNYEAKYISHDTSYLCPSNLSFDKEQQIQNLAKKAFNAANCSDWGRVDFVVNEQGDFYILEINTVPGLTATSLVPKSAKVKGLSFDDLIVNILNNASLKQDVNLAVTKDSKASV